MSPKQKTLKLVRDAREREVIDFRRVMLPRRSEHLEGARGFLWEWLRQGAWRNPEEAFAAADSYRAILRVQNLVSEKLSQLPLPEGSDEHEPTTPSA